MNRTPLPLTRLRTAAVVAGAALLTRRALRRRIARSPLWPLPALDEPISGHARRRRTTAGRRLLITGRTSPAEGVVQLRLEGPDLPAWEPGAHLDLVLPSGLVRQYSLCGDPADTGAYTVAVRLVEDGRGGSREVHTALREGREIEVHGPRNRFPLTGAPAHLLVAGGIGITPILPMVRALAAAGADWRLVYGGRSRATMPFLDALERLDAGTGRVTVVPQDEAGHPDLTAALADTAEGTAVHGCGPEPLMEAVAAALPPGRTLHLERFSPRGDDAADRTPFEVELRRTGRTVPVAAGESVLSAVRAEVPYVAYSCEQGFCGTCRQRVLEGEVDHRDELLNDEERRDSMLICVSRCRGERLVLDL